ncbi:MAG: 50S ribosomal protein L4, partial [Bacilli bacterium]|nr:50S ribosomal protein L4 [Bacilli bacterium]
MAEKKIKLPVFSLATGEKKGDVSVSAEVFGLTDINHQDIHDAVVVDQANRRQATAKTKKRHEVSGGGKKPYRQKGTGRARAGSTRSPIFVGGGTVFGPDGNQNYKLKQNKKAHNLALREVLSEKAKENLVVVEELSLEKISTKELAKLLAALKLEGKTLVVLDLPEDDKAFQGVENFVLSANNLEKVTLDELGNV